MQVTLILFGATGDLAQHKLLPSLFHLMDSSDNALDDLSIIAIGRREYTREQFLEQVKGNFQSTVTFTNEQWEQFAKRVSYLKINFHIAEEYLLLKTALASSGNCLFYLSVSAESYADILDNLAAQDLHLECEGYWKRIVMEKPFGSDSESAKELNDKITHCFSESQVYRIDHYLGKETVQNILAFRFGNKLFEPVWNNQIIDHIQITVAEEDGIKTRGAFYDQTGAFRDIVQNHILQLVTLVTMEDPSSLSRSALTKRKKEILQAITVDMSKTVFGQYKGYLQEKNVSSESKMETYAMACFYIHTPRWQGIPIYIRTGKKLTRKISEISIQFKDESSPLFDNPIDNTLRFRIQPDEGIALRLGVKAPRETTAIQPVKMEFCYSSVFKGPLPSAYELLFLDVIRDDHIHSLDAQIIEESWRIVDEILAAKESMELHLYEPGTWGPKISEKLLLDEGRQWQADESTVCNGVILEQYEQTNQGK